MLFRTDRFPQVAPVLQTHTVAYEVRSSLPALRPLSISYLQVYNKLLSKARPLGSLNFIFQFATQERKSHHSGLWWPPSFLDPSFQKSTLVLQRSPVLTYYSLPKCEL